MTKKAKPIPINSMTDDLGVGIAIERITFQQLPPKEYTIDEDRQSHRHDTHTFHLLEKGTVYIDVDFQQYTIKPSSVIYIHPDQVHRTKTSDNVTVVSLAITNENLNPDYLKILEDLVPAKPLELASDTFALLGETVSLCLKLAERRADKLYLSSLKDTCNVLVALILSNYLDQTKSTGRLSRFELITKSFRKFLAQNYTILKRPAEYAQKLNLSTAYLNECVKNTTGYSVSYHIQERIILEAKRLLCYSDLSVKEIAAQLGYDDYPYFSRFFTKATGITALTFRAKNRD